jgi:hypothetical protein
MDVAAMIPPTFIQPTQLADVAQYNVDAKTMGLVLPFDQLRMVLWNEYAFVMKSILTSPVVCAGYRRGWAPVLLLKNGIIQTPNGQPPRVASSNAPGMTRSFLCLAGFYLMTSPNTCI